MGKNVSRGVMWNDAAKAGIALGLVPVVYMFLVQFVAKGLGSHAVLAGALMILLRIVKIVVCIRLMTYFMKKFAAERKARNGDTFRFGCIAAICSAIIVSAGELANIIIINPELVNAQFSEAFENYGSTLDYNSQEALARVQDILPQLTFFLNLIYCFLFGVILSFILSRNIPPINPFARILDEMQRNANGRYNNGSDRNEDENIDDQGEAGKNDENELNSDMFR